MCYVARVSVKEKTCELRAIIPKPPCMNANVVSSREPNINRPDPRLQIPISLWIPHWEVHEAADWVADHIGFSATGEVDERALRRCHLSLSRLQHRLCYRFSRVNDFYFAFDVRALFNEDARGTEIAH